MTSFARMTVGQRLLLGFGLLLAILVGVTFVATSKVSIIDQALNANSDLNVPIQRYAINFRGSAHDRAIAARDVVLSATPADRQKEVATIARLAAFYAESAGPLEKLIAAPGADPALGGLYGDIKKIEAQTVATTQAIVDAVDKGDLAGAQTMLWTQAKPQYVQWLASINQLIDFQEQRIQAANQQSLAEGVFQRLDAQGHGRQGERQRLGRRTKTAVLDHGGLVGGDDGEVAAGDEDAGDDFVEFDEGEHFGAGGDAGADLDIAGDDDAVEGGAHGGVGVAEGRALEAEAGLVELEFLGFVVLLVDEFAPVEVVGAIEVALELFEIDAGFIGVDAELGVLDFEERIAGFDDAALLGEEGLDLAGGLRVEVDGGLGFEGGVEGEEGRNGAAHDGGGFDGDFFDGVLAGAVFLGLAGGG